MKKLYSLIFVSLIGFSVLAQSGNAETIKLEKEIIRNAKAMGDASVATYSMYKLIALEGANSTYKDSLAFIYFSSRRYGPCFLMSNEVLKRDPKNEPILEIKAISLESLGAIDKSLEARGGIENMQPNFHGSTREIFMFKRSKGKFGGNLGKTTGWIHRSTLKKKKVQFVGEVQYTKIDDLGLHYVQNNEAKILEVDNIVICAGQTPLKELMEPLMAKGMKVHIIGGADIAEELDAKRAIDQGSRLAAQL